MNSPMTSSPNTIKHAAFRHDRRHVFTNASGDQRPITAQEDTNLQEAWQIPVHGWVLITNPINI